MSEFHWQEGWYFKRLEGGAVRIQQRRVVSRDTRLVEAEAVIPAAEWCSIVAAVTLTGDDAATYQAATLLHGGEESMDATTASEVQGDSA